MASLIFRHCEEATATEAISYTIIGIAHLHDLPSKSRAVPVSSGKAPPSQ